MSINKGHTTNTFRIHNFHRLTGDASRNRFIEKTIYYVCLTVLFMVVVSISAAAQDSTQVLIREMEHDLYNIADKAPDDRTLRKAAMYFFFRGNYSRALGIVERADDAHSRSVYWSVAMEVAIASDDSELLDSTLIWWLSEAKKAEHPYDQEDHIRKVIKNAAKLNRPERAKALLTQALHIIQNSKSHFVRAGMLTELAAAFVELGDQELVYPLLAAAIGEIKKVNEEFRSEVKIAADHPGVYDEPVEYVGTGWTLERAARIALGLDDAKRADSLLIMAARHVRYIISVPFTDFARVGLWESLGEMINEIDDSSRAQDLLWQIAIESMGCPGSFVGTDHRDTLVELAADDGGTVRRDSLLSSALRHADSVESPAEKVVLLGYIASTASRLEDTGRVIHFITSAACKSAQIDSAVAETAALILISRTLIDLNMIERADSLLFVALGAAKGISDLGDMAHMMNTIAGEAYRLSDTERKDTILLAAIRDAEKVYISLGDASALNDLAEKALDYCDIDRADSLLRSALATAREIHRPSSKRRALNGIANIVVQFRDSVIVDSLLELLLKNMNTIPNPYDRATGWYYLAELFVKNGMMIRADSVLRMAISAAEQIDSAHNKSDALVQIAEAAMDIPDTDRVDSLMWLAVWVAKKIDRPDERARTLANLAERYYRRDMVKQRDSLIKMAILEIGNINIHRTEGRRNNVRVITSTILDIYDGAHYDSMLQLLLAAADKSDSTHAFRSEILRGIRSYALYDYGSKSVEVMLPILLRETEKNKNAYGKASMLVQIAQYMYEEDDVVMEGTMLTKAFESGKLIEDLQDKSWLMSSVAELAAQTGNAQLAHDAVYSIESPQYRVKPLLSALRWLTNPINQNSD